MSSQTLISNNNFMETLNAKQAMQSENAKAQSKINGLTEAKGDKKEGSGDADSALYAVLLAMSNMMNANMQSMGGGADHLTVCDNQISKGTIDVDQLNRELDQIGNSGSLQDQATFASSLQIDNTKLSGIQTDANISTTQIKNSVQNNENNQVQAQTVLDLISKTGHTQSR